MKEKDIKKLIIDIGKRIWTRGFVGGNDGNISVKLNENEFLTTPTGVSKGFMNEKMILKIDKDGNLLEKNNKYKPSSEIKMHLAVYKKREDINAVIHAHPPYATSFAVAGIKLDKFILPEAVLSLGKVPLCPYGTPSTMEIPQSLSEYINKTDVFLLENHGALTIGIDLIDAFYKMEILEHSSKIIHLAYQLGNVKEISKENVEKLKEIRKKLNIKGKVIL